MARSYRCRRSGRDASRRRRGRGHSQALIRSGQPLLQSCCVCFGAAARCYLGQLNPGSPESRSRPASFSCRSGCGRYPLGPGLRNRRSYPCWESGSRGGLCGAPRSCRPGTSLWNCDSAPGRRNASFRRWRPCQKSPGFPGRSRSPTGTRVCHPQSAGGEQKSKCFRHSDVS